MGSSSANDLARRAEFADRTGAASEANALWDELVALYPAHPRALLIQGRRRIERGDLLAGLQLLNQAETNDPTLGGAPLYAAMAHRMLGNHGAALAAIDRALSIEPYDFLALLSKGAILEHMNKPRLAARVFVNAIKIAPSPERLPPSQRAALEHARTAVRANAEALALFMRTRTALSRDHLKGERLERFDECLNILAGVQPRYVQEPILLYFPRLPPIPFYDREMFPWLAKLEAATDEIRDELIAVMRGDEADFAPYIQLPPEAPVNQWTELNHSPTWSTYFLWRDGVRQDANCQRCPQTSALIDELPLAHQSGFGPTVMFSVLAPHTHIPPHTGSSNTRLIVHLPLILPAKCRFRVGAETRDWRMGEAWVFDDTIEHEAWNDSDQSRVILIFDVWNPLVTEAERELVTEMMEALNAYNASNG